MRGLLSRCLLAGTVITAVPLFAQTFPPLDRQPILDAPLPASNPPIRRVHGARIHFAPGQPTGLHRHPVSVVGVVTEGSFLFQPEGEPARTLKAGDGFFEPAGTKILHFDNASATAGATIVAFYLTDKSSTPLIEPLAK